jgi:hypothetical protein
MLKEVNQISLRRYVLEQVMVHRWAEPLYAHPWDIPSIQIHRDGMSLNVFLGRPIHAYMCTDASIPSLHLWDIPSMSKYVDMGCPKHTCGTSH